MELLREEVVVEVEDRLHPEEEEAAAEAEGLACFDDQMKLNSMSSEVMEWLFVKLLEPEAARLTDEESCRDWAALGEAAARKCLE